MTCPIPENELLTGSPSALAAKYGVHRSSIYKWRAKYDEIPTVGVDPAFDDEEFLEAVANMAGTVLARDTQENEVDVELPGDKPVALAFSGDWHFGNRGTDYRALYSDIEVLSETPGVYVIGMGDYIDNYKVGMGKVTAGMYDAVLPSPEDQERGAQALLNQLAPKLLAATLGCHLDWEKQTNGTDPLRRMLKDIQNELGARPANMGYGGVIRIHLAGQTYSGLARHKYGNSAGTNSMGQQRKATTDYPVSGLWDFIALGHLHFNDLQKRSLAGRDQVWVRSGSYKVLDSYGQRIGGLMGEPGVPILILLPNEHRIIPFYGGDLGIALRVLEGLRNGSI
jgi:hypothetical protein